MRSNACVFVLPIKTTNTIVRQAYWLYLKTPLLIFTLLKLIFFENVFIGQQNNIE